MTLRRDREAPDGLRLIRSLEGHTASINRLAWSPDAKKIASAASDRSVRVWNIATGKCMHTLNSGGSELAYSVAWSPDGLSLATGTEESSLTSWDARSGEQVRSLDGHSGGYVTEAWSPNGERLVSGSFDCTANLKPIGQAVL